MHANCSGLKKKVHRPWEGWVEVVTGKWETNESTDIFREDEGKGALQKGKSTCQYTRVCRICRWHSVAGKQEWAMGSGQNVGHGYIMKDLVCKGKEFVFILLVIQSLVGKL